MHDPLDAALDRHPDYPPGFQYRDLEGFSNAEMPARTDISHALPNPPHAGLLNLVELQYSWVCLDLC